VDALLTAVASALMGEERRLALTPPPASTGDLSAALTASRQMLERIGGPFSTAPGFLDRIRRVRRSTLDSGLTEAA
jgi:hypothetical protein